MQKDNQDMPVRVVCATKLSKDQFVTSSQTGRSLFDLCRTSPVQVRLFEENAMGLFERYNQAIEEAKDSPSLLVFVHDDVLINDFFWTQRIYAGLKDFDIVGIAGNTRRSAESLNLKMGTIPLSIVHASYGSIDQAWHDSYQRYLAKWKT